MTDPAPIIVNIVEPEAAITDQIRDLLVGSLGLAGVLLLFAVLAGVAFGLGLFWLRSRRDDGPTTIGRS